MTTGEKIYELRKKSRITQEEFAEKLEVSRQAVSKWESDTAYPETDKLIKIAELFGVSCDYLLKENQTVNDSTCGKTRRTFLSMMVSFAITCNALGFVIALICYFAVSEWYSCLIGLGVYAGLVLAAFILWSIGRYLFLSKCDYLEIDKRHLARCTKAFFFTAIILLFLYLPCVIFIELEGSYVSNNGYFDITLTYMRKLTFGEYALSALVYGVTGYTVTALLNLAHEKVLGKHIGAVKICDGACVAACALAAAAAFGVCLYQSNYGNYPEGYYHKFYSILLAFAAVVLAAVTAQTIVHKIYEKTPTYVAVMQILNAALFFIISLNSFFLSYPYDVSDYPEWLYKTSLIIAGILTACCIATIVLASLAAATRKDYKQLLLLRLSVITYIIFGATMFSEIFLGMEFWKIMTAIAVYLPVLALLHAPFVKEKATI